jgi:VIT1/CCC1 family predicted Fe2+/Mn2+ transporter
MRPPVAKPQRFCSIDVKQRRSDLAKGRVDETEREELRLFVDFADDLMEDLGRERWEGERFVVVRGKRKSGSDAGKEGGLGYLNIER